MGYMNGNTESPEIGDPPVAPVSASIRWVTYFSSHFSALMQLFLIGQDFIYLLLLPPAHGQGGGTTAPISHHRQAESSESASDFGLATSWEMRIA